MKKGCVQMSTKLAIYPAVFELEKEPSYENYYNVSFPDVPSADTYGQGLVEATRNAWESLGLNLYDAKQLPLPSDFNQLQRKYPEAIIQYVVVDLKEFAKGVTKTIPKVNKNTSIPRDLANQAEELGLNFSAVLTKALYQEVKEINDLRT